MQSPQPEHAEKLEAETVAIPIEGEADRLKRKCRAHVEDEPRRQIPAKSNCP